MVVTRRTPAAPVPTSRNPSSQPIPRIAKKPDSDASSVPSKPVSPINGSTLISTKKANASETDESATSKSSRTKGKHKNKKGGKRSNKSTGFMEFVFRLFLLWFTIYTLAVCPEDEKLKSPVCRGLAQYRALVIEPYILPPIEHALAHPSVAPYVEKAKPYADYAVRAAKPLAARIHKEFDARVVPQWNKRVVPLYSKYAVPQLLKLDAQAAPYITLVEKEYQQHLAPYVKRALSTLHQLQVQARPYIAFAARKTYQAYQAARPYARPVWESIKGFLTQLAIIIGEQRRQFVDPHVQKIWEHVKEMSGKPQAPSATHTVSSQLHKASTQVARSLVNVSTSQSSAVSATMSGTSVVPSATAETSSSSVQDVPPVSTVPDSVESFVAGNSASFVDLKSTATAFDEPNSTKLSSEDQSTGHDSVSHDSVSQATPSASTSAVELGTAASSIASVDSSSTSTLAAISSAADDVSATVSSAAAVAKDEDSDFLSDPDLDAFKAELGLEEEDLLSDATADSLDHTQSQVETDEERESRIQARREKTAHDRVNIESRHTKWEAQVNEQIQVNKKALRKALVAIRKTAVVDLKDSQIIRNEVEGLIEDGEKFLRGADKYLANLQKETRSLEEKRKLWDRIVGKVEEKFNDRLRQTESVVNGWYQDVLKNELAEVEKLTYEVKDLAERAQADIGLDYAYLDDVTYQDWQRYHDLARRSENFTAYAHSVQDGSHQSPPINPVIPAVQELQDEVQDVISGFNARLRKIMRTGARAFGSPEAAKEDEEDGTASILPVEDAQQTEAPAAVVSQVVIGRGKEEVEAAMNRLVDDDTPKASLKDTDGAAPSEGMSHTAPQHLEL